MAMGAHSSPAGASCPGLCAVPVVLPACCPAPLPLHPDALWSFMDAAKHLSPTSAEVVAQEVPRCVAAAFEQHALCVCCLLHDARCSPPGDALDLLPCFPCAEEQQHHAQDAHHQTAGKGALWARGRAGPAVATCLHEQPLTCM